MKKLLYAIVMVTGITFGQETEFKLTKDGFTDYVVTECKDKTAAEMYKKTLDWISVTYKNPKEVIKAQIENDYVRIEGASSSLICLNILGMKNCFDTKYQIEISFKEGKYKFDVIELQYYVAPGQYTRGGWFPENFEKIDEYYNKKGEIKGRYKYYPETIPLYFNVTNTKLKEFILSESIPSKKSDW